MILQKIYHLKYDVEIDMYIHDITPQLAEWLEELKAIKSDGLTDNLLDMGFTKGYNKALDDFVKFASDMPTVEEDDGTIRPMWLEEMAEQLKAGGNIELSEHSKSQVNRTGK